MQAPSSWPNERWLEGLQEPCAHTSEAHAALLAFITQGLRHAFRDRPEAKAYLDDFAQEAIMRILRDLKQFRGESHFTTWAFSIAMRTAFDDLRKRRWKDISLDAILDSGDANHPAVVRAPDASIARERLYELLRFTIETRLTVGQRRALLGELKGVPLAVIAQDLGLTRNALYKLTHDARKVLKRELSNAGITTDTLKWALDHGERGSDDAQ